MIYFDKDTLSVLKHIYKKGDNGATWAELRTKFDDHANIFLLEALSRELYTVTKDKTEKSNFDKWIDFNTWEGPDCSNFISFISPRGKELLQKRSFDFWKWMIPTIISLLALALSVLTFIFTVGVDKIVKVLLL